VAVRTPAATGVNVMPTLHKLPGDNCPEQPGDEIVKSVPTIIGAVNVTGAVPVVRTVTFWELLVVLTVCALKASAGVSTATPLEMFCPIPVRSRTCGLPVASLWIWSVAVSVEAVDGVNVTPTRQAESGERLPVHAPACSVKSAALGPPIETPVNVTVAVPVFFTFNFDESNGVPMLDGPTDMAIGTMERTLDVAMPVPASPTNWGLPAPVSVN
jgi:hypothetical protein